MLIAACATASSEACPFPLPLAKNGGILDWYPFSYNFIPLLCIHTNCLVFLKNNKALFIVDSRSQGDALFTVVDAAKRSLMARTSSSERFVLARTMSHGVKLLALLADVMEAGTISRVTSMPSTGK